MVSFSLEIGEADKWLNYPLPNKKAAKGAMREQLLVGRGDSTRF